MHLHYRPFLTMPCGLLACILRDCDRTLTHEAFEFLLKHFIYEESPKELCPTWMQSFLDLISRGDIAAGDRSETDEKKRRKGARPDLQVCIEQFFILLYLHLSEPYRIYWLGKDKENWRALRDLIRAIAFVLDATLLRNQMMDETGRVTDPMGISFERGLVQFVQCLREYHSSGIMTVNGHIVLPEEMIHTLEAVTGNEIDDPFRAYFATIAGVEEDEFVYPDETTVYIGDIDRTRLLTACCRVSPSLLKPAPVIDSKVVKEIVEAGKWPPKSTNKDPSCRVIQSAPLVYLLFGRPIYIDVVSPSVLFADATVFDRQFGTGRLSLMCKRMRLPLKSTSVT